MNPLNFIKIGRTALGIMAVLGIFSMSSAQAANLHARHSLTGRAHYADARPSSLHRTPPDSYLQYKVYTVDQLVKQVTSNPRILAHYSRTFHVPESKVAQYMRDNVVESYIPASGRYTVYCVRPNGLIYPTVQHFKRGTKVFALRNGQPVMKWLCGNPLMSYLPAVHEKVVTKRVPVVKTITKVSPSVETLVPAQPAQEVVPVEEVAPVYQPHVPILASPNAVTRSLTSASHAITPAALLPIAILPAVGGSSGGGGSGGTTATTGGTTATTGGGTTTGTTGTTGGGTTTGTTATTGGGMTTGTSGGTTAGTTGTTGATSTTGGGTTSTSSTGGTTSTTGGSTSTTGGSTSTSTTGGTTSTTGSTGGTGGSTGGTTSTSSTGGTTTGTSGGTTVGQTIGGTTATTGGTTSAGGSTSVSSVPEMSTGASVGVGFIPIAIGALIASQRKKRADKSGQSS